jgi:hypothetical protein
MTTITHPDRKPSTAMKTNGATKMQLLHEALSRARMRRPQVDRIPEAHRSARRIAMEAHQRAARELGGSAH